MSRTIYQHFNTLSDSTRFRILRLVEQEELGVGELSRILETPQSTVSRHLKVLQAGQWVARRSVGTANLFSLNRDGIGDDGRALWTAAGGQIDIGREPYASDQRRLKSVLALRGVNATEFFERHASRWDALRKDLFGDRFMVPMMAAMLDSNTVVADLGCGTGEMLVQLGPMVKRIIGVDREEAMLSLARRRTAGLQCVDIREGKLEALPIADGIVDLALCMLVLHHIECPVDVLSEAHRILRPGGQLLMVDMLGHEREELRQNMGHRHLGFSRERLVELADASGLRLDRFQFLPENPDSLGPDLMVARLVR